MLTVLLSDLNVYVYHFTAMMLICSSIATYFICFHVYYECARIFMDALAYLLYVSQFKFLLVSIHVFYLARLVCLSSPTCFFLRYICIAATCNVVSHELFTVRLILLSLFMYRIAFVLKAALPATGTVISHHSSLYSKLCILLLPARNYYILNG